MLRDHIYAAASKAHQQTIVRKAQGVNDPVPCFYKLGGKSVIVAGSSLALKSRT